MRFALFLMPILGLLFSPPPAMAQERITTPLTESIAREAARLGTEAAPVAQDGSATATQANSTRPGQTLPTGTRVRVTATSSVDVPGVIRLDTPVAFRAESKSSAGGILASDENSVTLRRADGGRVTIPQPRGRVNGRIESWDGQTLTIARADGSLVTVPRGAIARIERFDGKSSRLHEAGRGFLTGAISGVGVVGALVLVACSAYSCSGDGPYLFTLSSATAVGALIGAIVGPRDRWTKVDVGSLDK